ncbi:hypothetical protein NM528_21780 (plasmid) [Shewanella algae]|uniref:Uncharacterized protein n=4 Tax=Bacteria TaxID=2 RepID=A0AAU6VPN1_UNCXX
MDTALRHKIWEVYVKEKRHPIIASKITQPSSDGVQLHDEALLKRTIAEHTHGNETYITCSQCGCGLFYRSGNNAQRRAAHLYHNTKFAKDLSLTENCPFYHHTPNTLFSEIYNGEGEWHLTTKEDLTVILENDPFVIPGTVKTEKYIFSDDPDTNTRRRPDIQFTDVNGQKWVIELTRWWMSPIVVLQREQFFQEKGTNLLWVFSADCALHNRSTYDLIMYGSNISKVDCADASRPQCNAFVASDRAMKMSREEGCLIIDVEYPEYKFIEANQEIGADFHFKLVALRELKTAPKHRLPYAVDTSESLSCAKLELYKHNRLRLAIKIANIRKNNQRHLALIELAENTMPPANLLSALETIPKSYRFHQLLSKQSLNAKRHLDTLHMHNVRKARYELITLLRKETSLITTRRNYRDTERLRHAEIASHETPIFENYKFEMTIARYRQVIKIQLAKIKSRKERALQLSKLKRVIQDLPAKVRNGAYSHQIALNSLNGIKTNSPIAISSPLLLCAIERAAGKIENTVQMKEKALLRAQTAQRERELAVRQKMEERALRTYNEANGFIEQLNTIGLKEVPISNSCDQIKYKRLINDCNTHKLLELKYSLEQAYSEAYTKMRDAHLAIAYPLTYRGWNPATDYSTELTQLFQTQNVRYHSKSLADLKNAIIQEWCGQLLSDFINGVLNELYQLRQSLQGMPQIDQVIQIQKNGGTYARRLARCLRIIINNRGAYIAQEDKERATWLRKLVLQKSLANW